MIRGAKTPGGHCIIDDSLGNCGTYRSQLFIGFIKKRARPTIKRFSCINFLNGPKGFDVKTVTAFSGQIMMDHSELQRLSFQYFMISQQRASTGFYSTEHKHATA